LQIVVLAGGRGTRLMPLTRDTPKSLIPVAGRPFIEHQLELFRRSGISEAVLCVGYLAQKIVDHLGDGERFGIRIRYSVEDKGLMGTAGALKKAEPLLDEIFLLTYGDSYLQVDYADVFERLRCSDRLGLMVVYRNFDRYDRSNVVAEGGFVKAYDKAGRSPGMVYIDYGLSAFRKEALSLVQAGAVADLEGLYKALISRGELLAYQAEKRFYEIGSFSGLRDFEEFASQRIPEVTV